MPSKTNGEYCRNVCVNRKLYLILIYLTLFICPSLTSSTDDRRPDASVQDTPVSIASEGRQGVISCTFDPVEVIRLYEDSTVLVVACCTTNGTDSRGGVPTRLRPFPVDPEIADSPYEGENGITTIFHDDINNITSWNSTFSIRGLFLGRTVFRFNMFETNVSEPVSVHQEGSIRADSSRPGYGSADDTSVFVYSVSVIRRERMIDHLFIVIVILLVCGGNVGMGCKVDLTVVKEVLRRPIAPIIGFCCQYLIMPLTAFSLVRLLGLTGGQALGFFAAGCAPGGSSTNMYSYLLGGDVSLSVTLTLISLLASLGMIPLYLFTIGRLIIEENAKIKIPFQNILYSLLSVLVPIAVGLVIQKKLPKVARIIVLCLRPFYIILILCLFTIGVYSNLYIFRLIRLTTVLAGCALPYAGFTLAAIAAAVCRQPRARILTIAIETGLQNTGIPIILMKLSLPQPDADLSIVAPVVVAMFMPLPLWIAVTIVEIRRRCCVKKARDDEALNGGGLDDVKGLDETKTGEFMISKGSLEDQNGTHDNGGEKVNEKSPKECVSMQTNL